MHHAELDITKKSKEESIEITSTLSPINERKV